MKNNQGVDYSHNMPPAKMVICLPKPLYARPSWFTKKLAKTISEQIHPTLSHEIGMYLVNNEAGK